MEHDTWVVIDDRPVDRTVLDVWLAALPPSIVRAKGFVRFTDEPDVEWEFQLVGRRHRLTGRERRARGDTRIVLIGLPAGTDDSTPSLPSWRAGIAAALTEEPS